ncbi:MAG: hypothetical protein Q9227_006197 [Pyrenula ochraceoflavens]
MLAKEFLTGQRLWSSRRIRCVSQLSLSFFACFILTWELVDYNSPTCAADIRAYTKNDLAYAVDCITQADSMRICYGAIGRAGGRYTALDPFPQALATRRVVKPDWILATRIIGEGCSWPEPYRSEREEAYLEWGRGVMEVVQDRLEEGAMKSHPVSLEEGGWEGVLNGVGKLRRKEVSGKKLVYMVA